MLALVFSAAFAVTAPLQNEAEEQFAKDVAKTREKAIDYLKQLQSPQGDWEGIGIGFLADMDGGCTALAALGLLEAGVPTNDAVIAKVIDYLVKLEPKKTYVVSLQTQVLARVDAKKHAKLIQENVDWLLKKALRKSGKLEGWSYPANNIADNSNTHFAVMGLHAAARAGAKVDAEVWKEIREMYERTQLKEGWSYYNDRPAEQVSNSMTACALVGLSVVAKYEKGAKQPAAFAKGMGLLVEMPYESPKSTFYNMMAVAELGRLIDTTEFKSGDKKRAWYREGVEQLVKMQKDNGSIGEGKQIDGTPHLSTAFALYFLGPPAKKK